MRATLIFSYRNPGKYAFNVLAGALEELEARGDVALVVARTRVQLHAATRAAVERGDATLVAWSFYSPSFPECVAELAWLRERVPAGWTSLAGGVHATAEPDETLRGGFDRVLVGEGEHALREIATRLARAASIDDVAGVTRLADETLVKNGRARSVDALDDFSAFGARRGLWGSIEITRGCIYACKFCQTPFVSKARFRHRSAANVAHHAGLLRHAGKRDVRFVSPTSLSYGSTDERVDLAAIEDLLARVRTAIGSEGRMFFGTFPSEVRPEHATPEALALLKKYVDNDNLVLGGQSGSARVLAESHRGHGVDAIERAVENCVAAGFTPNVDFLLGLPGEGREDVHATLALMERLLARGARVHGHTFMPLPGTPFRDAAPGVVDDETHARLDALSGNGRVYGAWREQIAIARTLADRRRRRAAK